MVRFGVGLLLGYRLTPFAPKAAPEPAELQEVRLSHRQLQVKVEGANR